MERIELKIRVFPDPVLRRRSSLVKEVFGKHRDTLSRMAQLMYEGNGIGLAAPQAGLNESMLVIDIGSGLYKIINPKIVYFSGKQVNQEGCLSLPGVCIKVKRANKIRVKALDEYGKPLDIEAEGLLACVFQHEMDHLKGKLIIDYASFLEKARISKALKKISSKTCPLTL